MKNKLPLIITSFLLLLTSCENVMPLDLAQPAVEEGIAQDKELFVPQEGIMRLGKQLENPYSVANMRRAMELLPPESRGGYSAEDIQPTHLYVKFKPANVDELDAMFWSNSDIHFYSYPLDYERLPGGSYYRDPSLPENVPTYYYASVPIDRPLPQECEYEILEELYIPDESTEYTRTLSPSFINAIVAKSFEITNNELTNDAIATRSDGKTRAKHTYSGTIRVMDDLMGVNVPVPGALIKCTRWFTTVTAITNTNGYYTMTRESTNDYNYDIYWERDYKYDIREGELDQAVTEGPKQEAGWSVDIDRSGYPRGINFATITRAAYRYFYGNTGGLDHLAPPSTGDLKICYKHSYKPNTQGEFFGAPTLEILGDIWIYGRNSESTWAPTQIIFATTAHEMGHANEYNAKTVLSYQTTDDFIHDGWGEFVGCYLSYLEYGELGDFVMADVSFDNFCISTWYNGQLNLEETLKWPTLRRDNYSSLFIDLYDNVNQRLIWGVSLLLDENISGYTPSLLNAIVNQVQDLDDLRSYLKMHKPSNVTDTMIDNFINYYSSNKPNENN